MTGRERDVLRRLIDARRRQQAQAPPVECLYCGAELATSPPRERKFYSDAHRKLYWSRHTERGRLWVLASAPRRAAAKRRRRAERQAA